MSSFLSFSLSLFFLPLFFPLGGCRLLEFNPVLHEGEEHPGVGHLALKNTPLEPGMVSGHICWERHLEGPARLGKGGGSVSECVHRALLEHDLAETPAEPLLEGLPRCRPSSRPKSRKSITTCSHPETEGETAAHSQAGRKGEVEMRNRRGRKGEKQKSCQYKEFIRGKSCCDLQDEDE